MAVKTPNTESEQDKAYDPAQKYYDREFNDIASNSKTADDLRKQEDAAGNNASDFDAWEKEMASDAKSKESTTKNIDSAKDQEERGDWKDNTSGQGGAPKGEKFANKLKGAMKKKGPVGTIAAILLGGGGALGFFGFSLMPITITEHFTNDTNDMGDSSYRKTVRVFGARLGGNLKEKLAACSGGASVKCKLGTFDKATVDRAEKEKFKLGDKTVSGDRIAASSLEFPDGQVAHSAQELETLLKNSIVAAAAFNVVHNIKTSPFIVSGWFKNVLAKMNLTKAKKIEGDTKEKAQKSYEASTKGEKGTVSTSAVADKAADNATEEQKRAAQGNTDAGNSTARQINEAIGKGTKLKSFGLKVTNGLAIPQLGCLTYNMARFISVTAKVKNALRFAGFAMIFLTLASSIKAHTATEAEVEQGVSVLAPSAYPTLVKNPDTGEMEPNPYIGQNALDSAAYKVVAYGDQISLLGYAKQFFIGGAFMGVLENILKSINSAVPGGQETMKVVCKVANSTAATVISFLAAPVFTAVMIAAASILPVEEWAAQLINLGIDAAAGLDLTNGVIGADAGNLLFIGTAFIMSKSAMKFGLKPGKLDAIKKNMVENNKVIESEIAINKYEASKTPFDVTNRYSFLGSMAYQLATFTPTLQQPFLTSAGKLLAAIPTSFNMLTKNANAAYSMPVADYSEMRFSQCNDDAYAAMKDKFTPDMGCVPRMVPVPLASSDNPDPNLPPPTPEPVIEYMQSTGQADPMTGQPIAGTNFEKYKKYCSDREDPWGSTSVAAEAQTDDPKWYTGEMCYDPAKEKDNNMASEYIGYRTTMGIIEREEFSTAGGAGGGTSNGPALPVSGDAKQLAQQIATMAESPDGAIKFTNPTTIAGLKAFAKGDPVKNSCSADFTLDPALLGTMVSLSSKFKILVNNIGFIDDRDFCDSGQHPKGAAIDINAISVIGGGSAGPGLNFSPSQLPIITAYANAWLVALAPGRGGVGQLGCGGFTVTPPPGATGINGNLHFADSCDHLHIDARVR